MTGSDYYCCAVDFAAYNDIYLNEVMPVYREKGAWAVMMLNNVSRMGYFSSDRSIKDYCEKVWKVKEM